MRQEFSCCEVYLVVFLNEVSGPVCFRAKSGQIDGRCLAGNFPIWMLLFYKCWLSHNILFEIEETLTREIHQKKKNSNLLRLFNVVTHLKWLYICKKKQKAFCVVYSLL